MSKLLQLRGGTTAEHASFTGSLREVTVDTDKDTLVVHDGSTVGGFPLARASDLNNFDADTLDGKQLATIESEYQAYATNAAAALVDSAPATLDTLNELAAALGDDPNFATTTAASLGTKLSLSGGAMTGPITTNSTIDGRNVSVDGAKLDGITAGATPYTAGAGLNLTGTSFSVQSDLRGEAWLIGRDGNDFYNVEGSLHRWYLDGAEDMRLSNNGDLHVEGNVIAYSTTISDERLKTDIVKIDSALDKVDQINGYTFTYTADGKKSAGVIAQEVEKVLPSAITESTLPLKTGDDATEYKTVQYDQLIGLLVEAVKELKAEVAALKGA